MDDSLYDLAGSYPHNFIIVHFHMQAGLTIIDP